MVCMYGRDIYSQYSHHTFYFTYNVVSCRAVKLLYSDDAEVRRRHPHCERCIITHCWLFLSPSRYIVCTDTMLQFCIRHIFELVINYHRQALDQYSEVIKGRTTSHINLEPIESGPRLACLKFSHIIG